MLFSLKADHLIQMNNIRKHINIVISGRVQGVGFRYSALHAAKRIGITGFVKNQYNGDVYVEAEGTPDQLKQFIAWCQEGPEYAEVDRISTAESTYKSFMEFKVGY